MVTDVGCDCWIFSRQSKIQKRPRRRKFKIGRLLSLFIRDSGAFGAQVKITVGYGGELGSLSGADLGGAELKLFAKYGMNSELVRHRRRGAQYGRAVGERIATVAERGCGAGAGDNLAGGDLVIIATFDQSADGDVTAYNLSASRRRVSKKPPGLACRQDRRARRSGRR